MLRTYTIALLTFLCSITSLSAADYHWIGGSGNWSDLNHWATTSGGSIHPQIVPSPFDDVFFDGNSGFVAGSSTVNLNVVNAFCHSMDWTGAMNTPTFTGSQGTNGNLYIYGSLTFIQNMAYQFGGSVHFLSTNGGNTITTGHQYFSKNTWFDGTGGSWSLLDSMSTTEFKLLEGDFHSNGNSIRAENFFANTASLTNDTLDLFHSNVYMYLRDSRFEVVADTSNSSVNNQRWLRTSLDSTNFYFIRPTTYNRQLDLILVDTAHIGEVIFSGGITNHSSSGLDQLAGNGPVYIEKVVMNKIGQISHSSNSTTTNLVHIDSTFIYGYHSSYGGYIQYCDCKYIHIENRGYLSRGLSEYVYIGGIGNIQDGYFDYVVMDSTANINYGNSFFQGTFIGKAVLNDDGNIIGRANQSSYPLDFDTLQLTAGQTYNFKDITTITQNGWMDAVGLCNAPITLKSQTTANFIINGNYLPPS